MTALPTEPQPLPTTRALLFVYISWCFIFAENFSLAQQLIPRCDWTVDLWYWKQFVNPLCHSLCPSIRYYLFPSLLSKELCFLMAGILASRTFYDNDNLVLSQYLPKYCLVLRASDVERAVITTKLMPFLVYLVCSSWKQMFARLKRDQVNRSWTVTCPFGQMRL